MKAYPLCLRGLLATGIAMVGGVSLASAATDVTACGNLGTGEYVLKNNITVSGSCFVITGDNVSIDFKGRTLTGDGSGAAVTDNAAATTGLVLRNGKIRGFANGIGLSASSDATLEKMDVSNSFGDGILVVGGRTTLRNSKAYDNGGNGVTLGTGSTVLKSSAYRNDVHGFNLLACCHSVSDSKATDNGVIGFLIEGCCSGADHLKASDNGNDGINMTACCNTLSDSQSQKNGQEGVELEGGTSHAIRTTAHGNGRDGFYFGADGNSADDCKANKNGEDGIDMTEVPGNRMTRNQTNANGGDGTAINCPGTLVSLKSKGNGGSNLSMSGGVCNVVDTKAP